MTFIKGIFLVFFFLFITLSFVSSDTIDGVIIQIPSTSSGSTIIINGSANHNDLQNIQGGSATERYHLTNAQYNNLGSTFNATYDATTLQWNGNYSILANGSLHINKDNWAFGDDWNSFNNSTWTYNETKLLSLIPANIKYYFWNVNATSPVNYTIMNTTVSNRPLNTTTVVGLVDNQVIVTRLNKNTNLTRISAGVITGHTHVNKTAGTKDLQVYGQVFKRTAGGVETLLTTTSFSNVLTNGVASEINILATIGETDLNVSDMLVWKLIAKVTGAGTAPNIQVNVEGNTNAGISLPVSSTDIKINEVDPIFTSANSSLARTGNCGAGLVQNTTASGVQCVLVTSSQWTDMATGIKYTGGTIGVGTNSESISTSFSDEIALLHGDTSGTHDIAFIGTDEAFSYPSSSKGVIFVYHNDANHDTDSITIQSSTQGVSGGTLYLNGAGGGAVKVGSMADGGSNANFIVDSGYSEVHVNGAYNALNVYQHDDTQQASYGAYDWNGGTPIEYLGMGTGTGASSYWTGKSYVVANNGHSLILGVEGSHEVLTIDTSDNSAFIGNVDATGYSVSTTGGVSDTYDDGTDTVITFTGGIATAISTAYDESLMRDITYLSNEDKTKVLVPITFYWNAKGLKQFSNSSSKTGIQQGYSAQDVLAIYPECIVPEKLKEFKYINTTKQVLFNATISSRVEVLSKDAFITKQVPITTKQNVSSYCLNGTQVKACITQVDVTTGLTKSVTTLKDGVTFNKTNGKFYTIEKTIIPTWKNVTSGSFRQIETNESVITYNRNCINQNELSRLQSVNADLERRLSILEARIG